MTVGMGPAFWQIRDAGDPYADYVIAHLWFDGDTTDRSQFAATYTASGGGVLGSGQLKFGSTSWDSRYTGGGGLYDARIGAGGTHLSPNNSKCTIEFWYYEPSAGSGGNQGHFSFTNSSTGHVLRVYSPSFKGDIAMDMNGGGVTPGSVSVTRSAWHYVAITRDGSAWEMWVDGVRVQTATNSTMNMGTHLSTTCVVDFASLSAANSTFASYYSNFRFTRDIVRDVSIVPTAPFPDPVP